MKIHQLNKLRRKVDIISKKVYTYSPHALQTTYMAKTVYHPRFNKKSLKKLRFKLYLRSGLVRMKLKRQATERRAQTWSDFARTKHAYLTRTLSMYQNHKNSSSSFKRNRLFTTYNSLNKQISRVSHKTYIPVVLNTQLTQINYLQTYAINNKTTHKHALSFVSNSQVNYEMQLKNIITSNTKKHYSLNWSIWPNIEIIKNSSICYIENQEINNQTLKHQPHLQIPYLLTQWLCEKNLIDSRSILSRGTTYVLSRVPTYKMNTYAAVSADKFRGNIHSKIGIIRSGVYDQWVTKDINSGILSKLNYFNQLTSFHRNLKLRSYARLSQTPLFTTNNNIKVSGNFTNVKEFFYIKTKITRIFNKVLHRKFQKISAILKVRVLVKKRRIRKLKAIKRSKKLRAIQFPTRTYRSYFKRKRVGSYERASWKRKLQRKKSVLRRNNFIRPYRRFKKKNRQKNKILNDLTYFSTKRLSRNLSSVKDFKKLNPSRKKFLNKTTHPNTSLKNTLRNNIFLFKKTLSNPKPLLPNQDTTNTSNKLKVINNFSLTNNHQTIYTQPQVLLACVLNITLLKSNILTSTPNFNNILNSNTGINSSQNAFHRIFTHKSKYNNLIPENALNKKISKIVLNSFKNNFFQENVISWYHNTMIRFIEDCSGKKILFQFYPFMDQDISTDFVVRYKRWLPRMVFYERRLGHRFFLEEALHIMHLSFYLKDPKIICNWLKAMILRISFWKTRSIFRFLKYLFFNYFQHVFDDLKIKGLKFRLKGKISAAGNSRKRTILYRIGKTSHSNTSLRVLNESTTINTFTGVMGFNVWIFY